VDGNRGGKSKGQSGFGAHALLACPAGRIEKESEIEIPKFQMQNPEDSKIQQQKEMARGIADLLARLHPEEQPLLRLQLAHWVARRIMEHRGEMHAPAGHAGQPQPGMIDSPPSNYEI
jgi:hypothetical protein